jgi:hypothetical protein
MLLETLPIVWKIVRDLPFKVKIFNFGANVASLDKLSAICLIVPINMIRPIFNYINPIISYQD